ncbi:MAG: RhuM family protein [Bacteroidales bacterium]
MANEIILYHTNTQEHIEVRIEQDTVWLTQVQMAELFHTTKQNISLHISNIFKEKELEKYSTVKEILTVQLEGTREVFRKVLYYNLDLIICVGYRVKSPRATQFRLWATRVLKEYLLKGYALNQRFESIEKKLHEHDKSFELLLNTNLPSKQGIFFEKQVFDAYTFVADIIRSAQTSIILIDNYIDDTVLTLLSKRKKCVEATIYTRKITKQMQLDIEKHNAQYPKIEVKTYTKSHDRFLVIDSKTVYHIGASLKDLGKKWFAFSNIKIDAKIILEKLT